MRGKTLRKVQDLLYMLIDMYGNTNTVRGGVEGKTIPDLEAVNDQEINPPLAEIRSAKRASLRNSVRGGP